MTIRSTRCSTTICYHSPTITMANSFHLPSCMIHKVSLRSHQLIGQLVQSRLSYHSAKWAFCMSTDLSQVFRRKVSSIPKILNHVWCVYWLSTDKIWFNNNTKSCFSKGSQSSQSTFSRKTIIRHVWSPGFSSNPSSSESSLVFNVSESLSFTWAQKWYKS